MVAASFRLESAQYLSYYRSVYSEVNRLQSNQEVRFEIVDQSCLSYYIPAKVDMDIVTTNDIVWPLENVVTDQSSSGSVCYAKFMPDREREFYLQSAHNAYFHLFAVFSNPSSP